MTKNSKNEINASEGRLAGKDYLFVINENITEIKLSVNNFFLMGVSQVY